MALPMFWLFLVFGLYIAPINAEEVAGVKAVAEASPEAILQKGVAALTEQFQRSSDPKEILAFLDKEIAGNFDFTYMGRLAAGYYWNSLDENQRTTFEQQFRQMFFQSLARQISNLGNPRIEFYPARPGSQPNEITVSARVMQPQGIPILMDFRFYRGEQGWKVFDVMADGSSAVLYYRHFYNDLVARYGLNALLNSANP